MKRVRTQTVPIESLVLDYAVYPRHEVDGTWVTRLANVRRAGQRLPPVIADVKSRRVSDGFHRVKAEQLLGGKSIQVEFCSYKNEADFVRHTVAANAQHGRPFSPFDQVRAVMLMKRCRITRDDIGHTLGLTDKRLTELLTHRLARKNGAPVPLKHTLRHLAGQELTDVQVEANSRSGGMRALYYVNQIRELLRADAIDWNEAALVEGLRALATDIKSQLAVGRA